VSDKCLKNARVPPPIIQVRRAGSAHVSDSIFGPVRQDHHLMADGADVDGERTSRLPAAQNMPVPIVRHSKPVTLRPDGLGGRVSRGRCPPCKPFFAPGAG